MAFFELFSSFCEHDLFELKTLLSLRSKIALQKKSLTNKENKLSRYIDSNFRTPIGFYQEEQASHNSDEMSLGADQ